MASDEPRGKYKIKTIAALTGVNPTLLRAWERRYGFLEPVRVSSHHRLYTEEDLTVLLRIQGMLNGGLSIGEVAALGRAQLLSGEVQPPSRPLPSRSGEGRIPPAVRDALQNLTTQPLSSRLPLEQRWKGEGLGVPSLRELQPSELATLVRLYQTVRDVYQVWLYSRDAPALEALNATLQPLRDRAFLSALEQFGSLSHSHDPVHRSAFCLVREGALPALLLRCRDVHWGADDLEQCALLARDHAKMLRNAWPTLDVALTTADSAPKLHMLPSILAKLKLLSTEGAPLRVVAGYTGPITCCCSETAALDRTLYELVDRAGASQRPLQVWAIAVDDGLVRIGLQSPEGNAAAPWDPNDYPAMAVSRAHGVSAEQALRQGYLGGDGGSWSWMHWPMVATGGDAPVCACEP